MLYLETEIAALVVFKWVVGRGSTVDGLESLKSGDEVSSDLMTGCLGWALSRGELVEEYAWLHMESWRSSSSDIGS